MTPVEFHFVLPTGTPLANSTVEIQLANSTITNSQAGVVLPRLITVQTDSLGKAIVNLWPSTTLYYVTVMDSASEAGLSYKFIVPEVSQGTTVRLQDIVVNNAPTSVTWDNAAMLSILNAKASANASAIAANASAVAASASAASISTAAATGVTDGNKGEVTIANAGTLWTVPGLAAKATLQSGALAASTTQAPSASAVQAALSGYAASGHGHSVAAISGLQAALDAKQAALVSGTNIKSVNGQSLLGSGDLVIAGGTGGTVIADVPYEPLPILNAPAVAETSRSIVALPIFEATAATINGTVAGITLSGAAATGKTVTSVAVVGSNLNITLSNPLTYGDVLNIAIAAGMVKNTANSLSAAMPTTAVANNLALPVPNAPVVAAGTNTTTTVAGTLSAGAGQTPNTYTLFYRAVGIATFTTGATVDYAGASTPFSIPGLLSGQSYEVRAKANNRSGASVDSSVLATAPNQSLTLDLVAVPAVAAYSLVRKLKTSYAGNACLIRSSAGGADIAVGFLNGLVNWSAAATALGANDAFLVTVYDQSGNGRDATQTNTIKQPIMATAGVINKHAVLFPAAKSIPANITGLATAGFSLAAPLVGANIFSVVSAVAAGNYRGITVLCASGDNDDYTSANSVSLVTHEFGKIRVDCGGGAENQYFQGALSVIAAKVLVTGGSTVRNNGFSNTVSGNANSSVGRVGANNRITFMGRWFGNIEETINGNLSEVIWYPALSDVDFLNVETSLRSTYGV